VQDFYHIKFTGNSRNFPFIVYKHDFTPRINIIYENIASGNIINWDMGYNGGVHLGKNYIKNISPHFKFDSTGITKSATYDNPETIDTIFFAKGQDLQIGKQKLTNMLIRFNKKGPTIIGTQIMRNYNFIINWFAKNIYLSKIDNILFHKGTN
jgi:hypothetical protein